MTSFSALNSPALVATAGAGTIYGIPFLEKAVASGDVTWGALRVAMLISYAITAFATSIPGRIDGENQSDFIADAKEKAFDVAEGDTLVTPSGWAFAIWAPIFIGELVFVTSQFLVPESSKVVAVVKKVSAPFIGAQLLQTLWCAAYRPKYKGPLIYISTALLSSAAYFLSKANSAFALATVPYSTIEYCLYFLPMTLHFGWITAATLINFNGSVAMNRPRSKKLIAFIGHVSVIAATAAGVFISLTRKAPVFGGVISWALFGISDGIAKRLESKTVEEKSKSVKAQGILSTVGAVLSLSASILAAFARKGDQFPAP